MYRPTNNLHENRRSFFWHSRLANRLAAYGPMSGFDASHEISQPGLRWYIRLVPIYVDVIIIPLIGLILASLIGTAAEKLVPGMGAGAPLFAGILLAGLLAGPVMRRLKISVPVISDLLKKGDLKRAKVRKAYAMSHLMAAAGILDDQFRRSYAYDPEIVIDKMAGGFKITCPIRPPHTLEKYASLVPAIQEFFGAVRVLADQQSRSRTGGFVTYRVFLRDPLAKSRQVGAWAIEPNDLSGKIRIGTNFDGTPARISLWQLHGMTAGTTGSGKSASTHVSIMGALSHPDTHVHLIDLKGGIETEVYREKATSFSADLRGAVDVLATVYSEMNRRNKYLVSIGARKVEPPSKGGPTAMPGIVVFFDEFGSAEPSKSDTDEQKDCKALIAYYVKELARLGRSAGISLNLISQRMSANVISTDARMLFRNRISFKADDSASVTMVLGDGWQNAGLRLDGPVEPGIGLRYDADSGELVEFRGFYLPDERIDALAARLPARSTAVILEHPELPSERKAREAREAAAEKKSSGGRKPRTRRSRRKGDDDDGSAPVPVSA